MSFQAMTWATAQNCGSPTTKLVLLMLANHANGHTGQCNPRHKTLAAECEIRVETLKDHLKRLAEAGLIEILPQFMDGVQLPNQYRLNLHRGWGEFHPGGGGEFHPGGGGEFHPGGGGEFRTGGGGEFRPTNNQEKNQEKNQEEKHTPQPPRGSARKRAPDLRPEDVAEQVWADWCALRKSKKAAVTATALEGIRREAKRAGLTMQQALETCCANGWQGLKAEWLAGKGGNGKPAKASRHTGFDEVNYSEGINDDGSF